MKHTPACLRGLLAALLCTSGLGASQAFAQATTPSPETSTATEEVIVLNPFTVSDDKALGYQVTNSISATRFARPIVDTPLTISVVTDGFLQDTGAKARFDEVYSYVPGMYADARADTATRSPWGGTATGSIRGFPVNAILRNGFARESNFSLRNVARVEVLKGPVSVLFGSAQPGGTINYLTKKPEFRNYGTFTFDYSDFMSKWDTSSSRSDGVEAGFEYNGHYQDLFAYRLNLYSSDRGGWRDREYFRQIGITPSVLFTPLKNLSVLVEYEHIRTDQNPGAQNPLSNKKWFADYANPPADVLAFHGLNAADYRSRIYANSTVWSDLTIAARGNTGAVAVEQGLIRLSDFGRELLPAGHPAGRPSYNFQGKGYFVDAETDTFFIDATYSPTSWLSLRAAGLSEDLNDGSLTTWRTEPKADLTWDMIAAGGNQRDMKNLRAQLDAVIKAEFWGTKHQVLLGTELLDQRVRTYDYSINYNNPGYTVLDRNGNLLSGSDVFRFFDPILHPVPDASGGATLATIPTRVDLDKHAEYIMWSGEFNLLGRRIMPNIGFRQESQDALTHSSAGIVTRTETSGDSKMYGVAVELTKGFNFFASLNENYMPNTNTRVRGVGVNRDINGVLVPGLQEDTKLNDQTGEGTDIGFKFQSADRVWSGSLTWFTVARTNIEIQDHASTDSDPRNQFGILYPDANGVPQVVNAGFIPARYFTTTGEDQNRGIELELFWSPSNNYQAFFGLAHIYDSGIKNNPALQGVEREILFNRRLAHSPEWQVSFWNKYTFTDGAFKGLSLGAGVRGMTEAVPIANNQRYSADFHKGFVAADLLIGYETKILGRTTDFALNINNAFDKLYSQGNAAYASPRRVQFSARVEF